MTCQNFLRGAANKSCFKSTNERLGKAHAPKKYV